MVGRILYFFQAEDGIRDVEGSRGLGDVYKKQPLCVSLEGPTMGNSHDEGVISPTAAQASCATA